MIIVLSGRERCENERIFAQLFAAPGDFVGPESPASTAPGVDRYDDEHAMYFVEVDAAEQINANVRITPTNTSSLIADRFPHLLAYEEIKRAPTIYELNRHRQLVSDVTGNNEVTTARLFEAVAVWCLEQRVSHLQMLINADALPAYHDLSPLARPLGQSQPASAGGGMPDDGEPLAIRWPVGPAFLSDVCKYRRAAEARAVLAADDMWRRIERTH
jgi:hypothetical protein